jgi:hypothetical protein
VIIVQRPSLYIENEEANVEADAFKSEDSEVFDVDSLTSTQTRYVS